MEHPILEQGGGALAAADLGPRCAGCGAKVLGMPMAERRMTLIRVIASVVSATASVLNLWFGPLS
jgi:hypothetical protein